jgi:mono/diheme cytochrome c family protein
MVYVFVAFWVLLALGVFFVAMRGGPRRRVERGAGEGTPAESSAGQRLMTLGVIVLVAFGLVVPALVLAHNGNDKAKEAVGGVELTASETKGRELFAQKCVFCHTLAAVKSFGRIGPNLDIHVGEDIATSAGREALVYNAIIEGRARGKGDMPALLYQGKEAEDVAKFVAAVAGR